MTNEELRDEIFLAKKKLSDLKVQYREQMIEQATKELAARGIVEDTIVAIKTYGGPGRGIFKGLSFDGNLVLPRVKNIKSDGTEGKLKLFVSRCEHITKESK